MILSKKSLERFASQGLIAFPEEAPKNPPKPEKERVYHSNEVMELIVEMAKAGYTGTQIGRMVKRHQATICCNLKRRGRYAYLTWEELEWLAAQRKREAGEEA